MTPDVNVIYVIMLIDKVKLYKEFTNNKTMVGVGLIDKILTAYKKHNNYYTGGSGDFIGRITKFLAEYHDEPSNKGYIFYNV